MEINCTVKSAPVGLLSLAVLALLLSAASSGWTLEKSAGEFLTEDGAVARVLGRPEVGEVVRGQNESARGAVEAESAFSNPEVSYEREQLFGRGGESEDAVGISKTFEISGGRRLRMEAAERMLAVAKIAGSRWRMELATETRLLFYDALQGQRRVTAYQDWVERLERVVVEVERRARAGDVSSYDLLTLTRELSFARAELVVEQAGNLRQQIELAAWVDEPLVAEGRIKLGGDLLPPGPPERSELKYVVAGSVEMLELDAGVEAVRARVKAADRSWAPDVTVSAAYKTAEAAGNRAHGYVIGISAPLPLLSRSRGERDMARADLRTELARRALTETRLSGVVRGRHAEAERLYRAAVELNDDLNSMARRLPEIAETAYRGGELGVLELVDAHRGHLESMLRSLELEFAARVARVELERLTGGEER